MRSESSAAVLRVLRPLGFERSLPSYYSPGSKFTVRLAAVPGTADPIQAYAVEDTPPAGWLVSNLSPGGVYDSLNRKVKFGPFFDSARRLLTYDLAPPANVSGPKTFSGFTSADGVETPTQGAATILPAPLHPADLAPADQRLSINEVTAYASSWRKAQTWNVGPNPIPVDYVTRAGLLWKNGETYVFDPGIGSPPLWWVNPPRVGQGNLNNAGLLAATANLSSATRVLPTAFTPGASFAVRIVVEPVAAVVVYALEERVATGLSITSVSDGGEFDAANQIIRWGPFFDNSRRELTYQAIVRATARNTLPFAGVVSFDGGAEPIRGANQLMGVIERTAIWVFAPGDFGLVLRDVDHKPYLIETSQDLRQWQPLTVTTNLDAMLRFTDLEALLVPYKFYRALPQAP